MPTVDPPPASTDRADMLIFGDTMIDRFLSTKDVDNFDRKNGRVICQDRGCFLGGSARIAANLKYLLQDKEKRWAGYHSPVFSKTGYSILLEDLPLGPFDIHARADLSGRWLSEKLRILDANNLTSLLKFFSTDRLLPEDQTDWLVHPVDRSRIVVFSDYRKGAITKGLIDHVLRHAQPELVVYDGYDLQLLWYLTNNPGVNQLVIKGSLLQWKEHLKTGDLNYEAVCVQLLSKEKPPIILLSNEAQPLLVKTHVNGLNIRAEYRPSYISGELPALCTNGAGDLLTAGLLCHWIQQSELTFSALFQSLHCGLTAAMEAVYSLLRRRQHCQDPTLELWQIHESNSNQTDDAGSLPQSSLSAGSRSGENLSG